MRRVSVLER